MAKLVIGTEVDTSGVDKGMAEIKQKTSKENIQINQWVDGVMTLSNGTRLIKKNEEEITEETREQVANINKTSMGLNKVVKNVAKWGLAVIGVRSAYSAVRRAISLVQSNNEQIANTFKVMSIAVANTLTPIVEKIVSLIKTIMLYIDYIYFRLTSKHLFDFSKAFADANKSASGTAKSVDKMTTSFDEMNVVQDTSSSGAGGGMAENPFEGWENFKPPKWLEKVTKVLQWIKDNWKLVVAGIVAIGIAFLVFKMLGKGGVVGEGITSILELAVIFGGLYLVLSSLTELLLIFADGSVKVNDAINLMLVVFTVLAGLMATIILLGPSMTAGLIPFSILVAEISAILLVMKVTLPTILDAVGSFITTTAPVLIVLLNTIGQNINLIIHALGDVLPPIINSVGSLFDKIFGGISKVVSTVGGVIVNVLNTAKDLTTTVLNAILNFINKLGPAINNFVDNAIIAVTKLINFMVSGIEYLINRLVIDALRGMISKINDMIPGSALDIKLPGYVAIERFRPRLAKGGIINMPGRGVPVGGGLARGGEVAPEGVIPLTDSQQMALLGEAIGKYININATVPVYVGNRLVMREMKRINAEDNFAYNR